MGYSPIVIVFKYLSITPSISHDRGNLTECLLFAYFFVNMVKYFNMENFYKKIRKVFNVLSGVVLRHKEIFALAIVMAIACFFRLWGLDNVPPGLYPDVAINGNDALDTLKTGQWKLFYPENNGREGLFMWLIAISFSIFGASVWGIKIVAAIFGILTVLGVYLLTKELLSKSLCDYRVVTQKYNPHPSEGEDKGGGNYSRYIALLASFFLAISFWHVNFSRLGFRAIMVPFFLVFGFYFLLKGFRKAKFLPILVSGVFFGLGFYTYISYRFVVIPLAVCLLFQLLAVRKEKKQKKFFLISACCLIIAIFLTALPIGIYFLHNIGDFFGRAGGVSVFSRSNPVLELGKSLALHLGMFNFYGDANWRHNFVGSPELLYSVGVFFLIGFTLLIKKIIFFKKDKNSATPAHNAQQANKLACLRSDTGGYVLSSGLFIPAFLFTWFFAMLLPGVLSYEGIPHSLRVIGAIPPVFIFVGIGSVWVFGKIKTLFNTKNQKTLLALCVVVFLFANLYAEWDKYFIQWGENSAVKDAFSENYVKIGKYLNSLPEQVSKYVIVNQGGVAVPYPNGIPVSSQTTMFIERTQFGYLRAEYLLPENINEIKINNNRAVIIPLQNDENLFKQLSEKFPDGKVIQQKGIYIFRN